MVPLVELLPDVRDGLGESPLWDPDAQALFRVDSLVPCVHRLASPSGPARCWEVPAPVGSIGLGRPGHLLAALQDGFYDLDLDTGDVGPFRILDVPAGNRMNDGKMDRDGRFVCGTMQVEDGAPPGALFRLGADGACEQLADGVGIANGTCFSPDGGTLYFTDSRVGILWAYPYDRRTGEVGARTPLVDLHAAAGSAADGATVDAEGFIWAALVRTGQLARLAPDGTLDRTIDLPVPHPTCPAFGGPALDVLYVTSISRSVRMRSEHPEAGRMIAITGLGVRGLPEARFGAGAAERRP